MRILGNNRFYAIFFLIALFMFPVMGFGQSLYVSGKVTDAATLQPVNATVVLQSSPDASEVYIEKTNETDGKYMVRIHHAMKYLIKVSAEHYKPEIDTLFLSGDMANVDFKLLSVKPGQVLRLHKIYFSRGDYHIQDSSFQELNELLLLLNQYPDMDIRLEGHTDRLGGRESNLILSRNRVEEIKKFLTGRGINDKRIQTKAYGGSRPISTENTEESRQLNRRVEVRILKM